MGAKKSTFKSRVGKGMIKDICLTLADTIETLDMLVWESVSFLQADHDLETKEIADVMEDILRLETAKSGALTSLFLLDKKFAKPIMKDATDSQVKLMRFITKGMVDDNGED